MYQNWHHSAIGQSHKRMKFSMIFFAPRALCTCCVCACVPGTKQNAYLSLQYNFLFVRIHVPRSHLLFCDKDNAYVAECFPDAPSIYMMWGLFYHSKRCTKTGGILWKSTSSRSCKRARALWYVEFVCTISVRLYLSMCIMCVPVDFTIYTMQYGC